MKIPVATTPPYDVEVGPGVRGRVAALVAATRPMARAAAVVTTAPLRHWPWSGVDTGLDQMVLEVPDGERAKSLAEVERLCDAFAEAGLSRDDVVVALGGGAVTDLAGFAAAVYLRGVSVVHVPTTLLAMVDASVGGKTGVNLRAGKNLVGAFHQPLGVLADTEVLATLPERERRSGLGEIAKCWLLEGRDSDAVIQADDETLIAVSLELKARLVARDEHELGARALLNYGHTLGHAVERLVLERDPDGLRHGEAVAVGIAFAVRVAARLGRVGDAVVDEHDRILAALGLRRWLPPGLSVDELMAYMARDKKARHDLRFVLPGPDGFELVAGIDADVVRAALATFAAESLGRGATGE